MIDDLTFQLSETAQPDSTRIARATKLLKEKYYTDPSCLPALIHIMQTSTSVQIRQLAAVEARKQVAAHWPSIDDTTKANVRNSIYQSSIQEPEKLVRHSSSRVVAAIASIDLEQGAWQDLPKLLVNGATSSSASERVWSLYVLYILLETAESVFADKTHDLFRLFTMTIQDQDSIEVRATSLLAIGRISEIVDGSDKAAVKAFRALLPLMVKVLKETIDSDDSENAKQAFETFQTFLILEPQLISKNLPDLLEFMMQLGLTKTIDDEFRVMALSWIMTCIRFRKNKIKALKVGPQLIRAMLTIGAEEDSEDAEEDCPSRLAYRCIDTLSTSLPPSQAYEPLLAATQDLLRSPDAGTRKSALIGIGVGIEGAVDYVSNKLDYIIPAIQHGLSDSAAIVQRAALLALGQLSDDLPSEVAEHHETLLPLVFTLMQSQGEKVGKTAMTALEALLEGLEKEQMIKYLPDLMNAFIAILDGSNETDIKGTVVAAIGSAAHSSEESFMPYLDATITRIAPYLLVTQGEAELDLRGVVTDCLGAILGAVGKDGFGRYIDEIARAAFAGLSLNHARLRECSFIFFSIMARVLKEDFAGYLDLIVPVLISSLEQDEMGDENVETEEIDLTGENDDDDEDLMRSMGFNSAIAMEKEIAAEALGEIFAHTKHAFARFIEGSIKTLLASLNHFYEGVRKSCISSLYRFLTTTYQFSHPEPWTQGENAALPADVSALSTTIRKEIIDLLISEDEKIVVSEVLRNISETMKACGPGILGPQEDIQKLCDLVMQCLTRSHPCQSDNYGLEAEEDEDAIEGEDEETAELDALVIDASSDTITALSKVLSTQFTHAFSTFLPVLIRLFGSKSSAERASIVACLGESAAALSSSITPFATQILEILIRGLKDGDKEVRSNSAYSVGLLIASSNANHAEKYGEIMTLVHALMGGDNHALASDNAIGCLARMIMRDPANMPMTACLGVIVRALPLTSDFAENEPVYRMICKLHREGNVEVVPFLEQLVPIIVGVLRAKEQVSTATRGELEDLCRSLNVNY